jgi:hypothetical protein
LFDFKSSFHVKDAVSRPSNWRYDSLCTIQDDFLIAINCFDHPLAGYAYVDLRTFQRGDEEDPWTSITTDAWHGKNAQFVFSVEQDLALTVL